MVKAITSFSGISVTDSIKAKEFYVGTLGLKLENEEMGLHILLPGGGRLFLYEKYDHQPATFTILNLVVSNIDEAVDDLVSRGIKFERYDNMPSAQDDKGVLRGLSVNQGPDIAWFKDPSGNILSLLQEK
ncbi:MAG: VOC family protein [Candidatus Saccharimonadales bacterium]